MSVYKYNGGSPSSGQYNYNVFPSTVTPSVWFDGNQQAYSDSAGTIPVSSGKIRRINEASPYNGVWLSPSDLERPLKDPQAVRFECIGPGATYNGYQMTRVNTGAVTANAATIVMTFVTRDNSLAGQGMGIFRSDSQLLGAWCAGSAFAIMNTTGTWFPTIQMQAAARNTLVVRYSPTKIDLLLIANGTVKTETYTATIAATSLTQDWRVGVNGAGYFYASLGQAMLINRSVTDAEMTALANWADGIYMPPAYPATSAVLSWIGDSITRSTACDYSACFAFRSLYDIRQTYPNVENANTAIGGTGVTSVQSSVMVTNAQSYYNKLRPANICIIMLGTNDINNGNSVAYTLYGSGAPVGSGLYPLCDLMRAQGWKVVLCTIGPRTDNPGFQATYNARRLAMNTDIITNGLSHADRVVDLTQIVNFGFDSDSDNTTYYSADKIHPNDNGHALAYPPIAAAVKSLLGI